MRVESVATPSASARLLRDAGSALLWVVMIVPPAFGFWLVAGDLAGVPAGDRQTLIVGSLVGLGLATLVQVLVGYRMPVFEGPASTYLAAVAVVSVGAYAGHPEAITGGLLVAAVLVLLMGACGADRLLRRLFTPPVVVAFLLIVVLAVVPATVERAIGSDGAHPWGVWAAWISSAVVVLVGVGGQALGALRSYSLLVALALGTLVYALLHGLPAAAAGRGWAAPELLPWGAPELGGSIVAPFLIAGVLAAFNAIASINVMAATLDTPAPPRAERRSLIVHGGTQAVAACFGNVLGNVPRLDSAAIVRLIGNPRPRALALAAGGVLAIAFIGPAVEALARLPISVSAALVAVVLGLMVEQSLRQAAGFDNRRRWLVVAPAVAPAFLWMGLSDSLSEQAQLIANPMLIGVVLAITLDHFVSAPPRGTGPQALTR